MHRPRNQWKLISVHYKTQWISYRNKIKPSLWSYRKKQASTSIIWYWWHFTATMAVNNQILGMCPACHSCPTRMCPANRWQGGTLVVRVLQAETLMRKLSGSLMSLLLPCLHDVSEYSQAKREGAPSAGARPHLKLLFVLENSYFFFRKVPLWSSKVSQCEWCPAHMESSRSLCREENVNIKNRGEIMYVCRSHR